MRPKTQQPSIVNYLLCIEVATDRHPTEEGINGALEVIASLTIAVDAVMSGPSLMTPTEAFGILSRNDEHIRHELEREEVAKKQAKPLWVLKHVIHAELDIYRLLMVQAPTFTYACSGLFGPRILPVTVQSGTFECSHRLFVAADR